MYAGHAALATLVKGVRPRVPIGLLVPVAFAPDWIGWFLEAVNYNDPELSHSFISLGIGATTVALIYYFVSRVRADAIAVWLTYVSHWGADFFTGLKPTWPGGPLVGLSLYTRPPIDGVIECVVIILCWLVYRRSLPRVAQNRAVGLLIPLGLIAMHLAFLATRIPSLRR